LYWNKIKKRNFKRKNSIQITYEQADRDSSQVKRLEIHLDELSLLFNNPVQIKSEFKDLTTLVDFIYKKLVDRTRITNTLS
jgi:hypothetical protein